MALFYVDAKGALSDSVKASGTDDDVVRGRWLSRCALAELALEFEVCLGQPEGPELLAERLRMLAAGKPDPFAALLDRTALTYVSVGTGAATPTTRTKYPAMLVEAVVQSVSNLLRMLVPLSLYPPRRHWRSWAERTARSESRRATVGASAGRQRH